MDSKYCRGCDTTKPADEYYKISGKYLSALCKLCDRKKSKAYAEAHPDRRAVYAQRHRDKTRDTIEGKAREIHEGMVERSRRRGWDRPEWTIPEVIEAIRDGRCAISSIPFEFERRSSGQRNPWVPVPDRIDSSVGYTKENVQWVCNMANTMKQEWTMDEVRIFIEALRES